MPAAKQPSIPRPTEPGSTQCTAPRVAITTSSPSSTSSRRPVIDSSHTAPARPRAAPPAMAPSAVRVAARAPPPPKASASSRGKASKATRLLWPTQRMRQREVGPSASTSRRVTSVALGALEIARAGATTARRQSPLPIRTAVPTSSAVQPISAADRARMRGPTRRKVVKRNCEPTPNRMNPIATSDTAWRGAAVASPSSRIEAALSSPTTRSSRCGPSSSPTSR